MSDVTNHAIEVEMTTAMLGRQAPPMAAYPAYIGLDVHKDTMYELGRKRTREPV